jgi:transcriptional regulator with XRE-family HTH domain
MLEEAEEIGKRVKRFRLRLGQTQADLAAALGRTQGWVSKLESGRIELDRVGLLNQLAAELHVHPNDLIGRPYQADAPAENLWQVAASAIMRELRRYDLTVFDGPPRASTVMWGEMTRLHRLRDAAANVAILRTLPDLMREVRAFAEVSTGHEQEEAFALYAVACKFAHTPAHALGHPELVAMACERTGWAASRSGDPVMPAVASWMRVWDMWATADWDDAMALSDVALGSLEDSWTAGEPLAVRAWGSLQLRAAVSAARANDGDETAARIALAKTAADRMAAETGPPVYDRHSLTFSPGNVQIHSVSVALEMGDQSEALRMNARTSPELVAALPNSRQGHHLFSAGFRGPTLARSVGPTPSIG